MTCKELIEFLMDYLGGRLSPGELARFHEHLGECPDCVAYVDMYKKTVEMGKAVYLEGCDEVPADVPDDLVRAILAARPTIGQPSET